MPFLLKYYNALEWESRFTLALNVVENIDHIKKCFRQKLFIIEFPTKKNLSGRISLSTPEVKIKSFKDLLFLKYYNSEEWECITLGLKTEKDIDYI